MFAFDELDNYYGGIDAYLIEVIGVGPESWESLRQRYLR